MKTAQLADITQEEFDSAVQLVISGIKASDPKLDTRLGTVLRSLLVNPEARISATTAKQIEYVRQATSLKMLQEAKDAGEDVDAADVNAIMSNFNIKSATGTLAEGIVKISVVDGEQSYTIPEGTEFTTIEGFVYVSTSQVVAQKAGANLTVTPNTELYQGAASYYFLVPVVAQQVGAEFNITQGTSLVMDVSLYTFIGAEAYRSFSGGSDIADLKTTIAQIPAGLSIRGFVNKNACEGMLRDQFDNGPNPIIACSAVGYGNGAQRRDKHNLFGVGVGGRVDLYIRNFGDLNTKTATVTGTKIPGSTSGSVGGVKYSLEITPDLFPGSYWVKDVSCTEKVNSPLDFSCTRTSYNTDSTWHDFDVRKNSSETFNSIWQGLSVTVNEVPPDGGTETSTENDDSWSDTRTFSVTVYCLPQAKALQDYVDREDVRSVSTDVVVRCPIICNVSVSAKVMYDPANPIDLEGTKYKIRKYINSLGFTNALTRSEIVHILKNCGAVSVDLNKKDMLYGVLYDAFGKEYNLSGDSLSLEGLADDDAMLSPDTTIFAAEPENIQLILVPNE